MTIAPYNRNVSLALNGMTFSFNEPEWGPATFTPVVSKDGCPGYRIVRNGKTHYAYLHAVSNEPMVVLCVGPHFHPEEDGAFHFHDLREEFQ